MNKEIETLLDEYVYKSENPEEGDNFEEAMFLEEDICNKFGIKQVPEVSNMFAVFLKSKDKKEFFSQIEAYAESYLSSDPDTPSSLLEKAVANKLDAQEVLPELDITTHIYPLFVYEDILLAGKDSVENVLEEFNMIKKLYDEEVLDDIGRITFSKMIPGDHPLYAKLEKSGLKYLKQFFATQTDMYRSMLKP
jgi:hypothetical protein